jgi:uncharacterized protein
MVPGVRLGGFWPWVLIAVGGLLIAVGGTLLGPTGHDPSTVPTPETTWGARYNGIPAYPPSEQWRVAGTFWPFDQPTTVTTGAVVEGLEHHHNTVGVIDFQLAGAALQLAAPTAGCMCCSPMQPAA